MGDGHTSNIPIERKLELIRLMRNESQHNRLKMQGRERVIYEGSGAGKVFFDEAGLENSTQDGVFSFSSFKLRFLAALLLFAAFVAWDNGYYPALPENNGQVYSMIEEDMLSANLFAFIEDFTYTLKD